MMEKFSSMGKDKINKISSVRRLAILKMATIKDPDYFMVEALDDVEDFFNNIGDPSLPRITGWSMEESFDTAEMLPQFSRNDALEMRGMAGLRVKLNPSGINDLAFDVEMTIPKRLRYSPEEVDQMSTGLSQSLQSVAKQYGIDPPQKTIQEEYNATTTVVRLILKETNLEDITQTQPNIFVV